MSKQPDIEADFLSGTVRRSHEGRQRSGPESDKRISGGVLLFGICIQKT
jgi:hypothetical protein